MTNGNQDKDIPLGDLDSVRLLFPNDYVGSEDLKGEDRTVTIVKVTLRDLRLSNNETERKPIVHFKEAKKKLVLNKTNATTIADLYGTKPSAWVGQPVTLFATTCQAFGKTVDCIRIRDRIPATAAAPAGETLGDYE